MGAAFATVGIVYLVVAGITLLAARSPMRQVNPPEETVRTLKEDVEWLRSRRNAS